MLELSPLSLYIHIPWCVRKCPYCDFNSHQANGDVPETEYVKALVEDLHFESTRRNEQDKRPLRSIFFGGGTPSLFSARAIDSILNAAEKQFGFANDIEITLEANPGTAEAQRFKDYVSVGVNRLSIGIQSFADSKLKTLGRIHTSAEARHAIALCREAGIDNLNLDLMHGLPNQTLEEAIADLDEAISFDPTHISWYQLTIEPNTEFHNKPPTLPDDSIAWEINNRGFEVLERAGYQRYEVSAFAKPEKQSQHNMNYWQYGDYVGIGAGAHGKLSDSWQGQIVRNRKKKQPNHYIEASANREAERIEVAAGDRPFEYLLNSLRLTEGFNVSDFEKRTGVAFSSIAKQVEYLSAQELLAVSDNTVKTTARGYRVLNSVLEEFLEPS